MKTPSGLARLLATAALAFALALAVRPSWSGEAAGEREPKSFSRTLTLREAQVVQIPIPAGRRLVVRDVMSQEFGFVNFGRSSPGLFLCSCAPDGSSAVSQLDMLPDAGWNPTKSDGVAWYEKHLTGGFVVEGPLALGVIAYGLDEYLDFRVTLCGTLE